MHTHWIIASGADKTFGRCLNISIEFVDLFRLFVEYRICCLSRGTMNVSFKRFCVVFAFFYNFRETQSTEPLSTLSEQNGERVLSPCGYSQLVVIVCVYVVGLCTNCYCLLFWKWVVARFELDSIHCRRVLLGAFMCWATSRRAREPTDRSAKASKIERTQITTTATTQNCNTTSS